MILEAQRCFIFWILCLQGFQTRSLRSNLVRDFRDILEWKDFPPHQKISQNISNSNEIYVPDYQDDLSADNKANKLPEDSKHVYYYPHFENYQYSGEPDEQAEQGDAGMENSLQRPSGQTVLSPWENYLPNREFRGKGNPEVLPSWDKPKVIGTEGDAKSKLTEGVSNYKNYPTYMSQSDYNSQDNFYLPLEDNKIERVWKGSEGLPVRQNQISSMTSYTEVNEVPGRKVESSRTSNQKAESLLIHLLKTKPSTKKISVESVTILKGITKYTSANHRPTVLTPSSKRVGESFTHKTNDTFFEVSPRASNIKPDDSSSIMKSLLLLFENNKSLLNETINQFFKVDESKKSIIKINSKEVKDADVRSTDTGNEEKPKHDGFLKYGALKSSFSNRPTISANEESLSGGNSDVRRCSYPNCEGRRSHMIQIRNIHTDEDSGVANLHLKDPSVLMLISFNAAFFVLAVVLLKVAVHFTRSKFRLWNKKAETTSEFGLDMELYDVSNRKQQGSAANRKSGLKKLNGSDSSNIFSIE